jgi:hypothetical protein
MTLDKKQKKRLRKKVLVDRKLQLQLAVRMIGYWVGIWGLIFGFPFVALLIYRVATSQGSVSELMPKLIDDFWFPAVMSLLMAPLVVRDCIRFSHRIAGPIFRLQREMQNLADGKETEEVRPRDADFCQEIAGQFNRLVRKFAKQEKPQV